ncbi:ArsR family transcriptional regulator [Aurantiacibacter xanthus]|uniref:ArsR family transcriptional regulator n=1 Tax=Aurantiacibacter xanthus TaxID=1784712 RepID=A0A3A1NYT5_9SPHN|nr:helix-turn-helix domain-containing protein [Aurantiacibacter xanthus]RIV80065.1 ArsR family transcriptional regulator [Aurantiacibacter xanthus]
MQDDPVNRLPSEYDTEEVLENAKFLPHILTVANNNYAWHTSKMYLEILGIGVNETRILSILYEYGELQAWKICDILQMNKATVSQSIRSLQGKGLVEIHHQREGRFIRPTSASKSVHRQIVRMARSREEILLDGFSAEERRMFIDFLERFHRNLPKAIAYAEKHFG